MRKVFLSVSLLLVSVMVGANAVHAESKFKDPLDYPAVMRTEIVKRPFLSVAKAGTSLVAVGSRGMIATSNDGGSTWVQSNVPVQSDLLSISFPTEKDGWVVGHDGVILNTRDAGKTWEKQFDGRIAAQQFKDFYSDPNNTEEFDREKMLRMVEQNYVAGPALPFLDVWFDDLNTGYVVGSFGLLAKTTDGGKTWLPWMHRIQNEEVLNLNGVRTLMGRTFIVGERGRVYTLDPSSQVFREVQTGYNGSFFGIVQSNKSLFAFGLRGVTYQSLDSGATWEPYPMPSNATITGAASNLNLTVLTTSTGRILFKGLESKQFEVMSPNAPMRYTGLIFNEKGNLVLTGLQGIRVENVDLPVEANIQK